jgi:hypothetical protein
MITFFMQTNMSWFTNFTIGSDAPGVRHFRDDVEQSEPMAPGWTETDVVYEINSQGYRGHLEPGLGEPAAFGCSFTFGTGVNHPWPSYLDIVNCGQPGASNDKIARLALSYCATFKPNCIYIMWTFPQRREWINHHSEPVAFKNMNEAEYRAAQQKKTVDWDNSHLYLMNDYWDNYNYEKNCLLARSYCAANNIKLFETTVTELDHRQYAPARDGVHPGPDWHVNVFTRFSHT